LRGEEKEKLPHPSTVAQAVRSVQDLVNPLFDTAYAPIVIAWYSEDLIELTVDGVDRFKPSHSADKNKEVEFRVQNITRGTSIGGSIGTAQTSAERRVGLLKHHTLEGGSGLWIAPCEAVHTFFMKFAIDLIYLDRKHRVRGIVHALPPWRFSLCLPAHSVLELPPGTIHRTNTQKGDQLAFEQAA
jgi:hypothetical protein